MNLCKFRQVTHYLGAAARRTAKQSLLVQLRFLQQNKPAGTGGNVGSSSAFMRFVREIDELPAKSLTPLLLPASILVGFGLWQSERGREALKELYLKTKQEPAELPLSLAEYAFPELEYRPFRVVGHFDHKNEIIVAPKKKVRDRMSGKRFVPELGSEGAYVITPFEMEDGRRWRILVNRGWVPTHRIDPETRKDGQVEGTVELTGALILRDDPKHFLSFLERNDPESNVWHNIDIFAMSKHRQTLAILLAADEKSTVREGPIGGQAKVRLENQLTFMTPLIYSVCILTTVAWYAIFVKKIRCTRQFSALFENK